jgi:hypothetical protein
VLCYFLVYTGTEGAPLRKLAEAEAALQEAILRGASDADLQMLERNVTDKKNKHSKTKWGTLACTLLLHCFLTLPYLLELILD